MLLRRVERHFRVRFICRSLLCLPLSCKTARICPFTIYNHNVDIECADGLSFQHQVVLDRFGFNGCCMIHQCASWETVYLWYSICHGCQRPALFGPLRPELSNLTSQILFGYVDITLSNATLAPWRFVYQEHRLFGYVCSCCQLFMSTISILSNNGLLMSCCFQTGI